MATAPIDDTGAGEQRDNDNDAPALSEVEQIAVEKGWKPKDQFRGTDTEWRPASEFLRHMPGTRDLKREIGELKSSIAGITKAADRQVRREVADRTKEIEQRFADAVEAKDTKGAAAAAKDMRELEAEQVADAGGAPEDYDRKFASDNPWYGKDEEATAYAQSVSNLLGKKKVPFADQLPQIAEAVYKRFPELKPDGDKQEDGGKPKTLTLNAPGRTVERAGGKSYADLPDAAKRAADRFYESAKVRNGDKVPDRKTFDANYAKDYYADA